MDQIWFWDKAANVWNFYGYQKPRQKDAVASWKKYDNREDSFSKIDPLTDVLEQGDSFLYIHNEDGPIEITFSGAVKPFDRKKTYTLASGQSQYIAYPWPVSIKISDFNAEKFLKDHTMVGTSAWGLSMDQIWLWDQTANVWKFYGYQKPRQKEAVANWKRYDNREETFANVTDADVIPADEGILYIHNEDGDLTINFAYDK